MDRGNVLFDLFCVAVAAVSAEAQQQVRIKLLHHQVETCTLHTCHSTWAKVVLITFDFVSLPT